MNVGTPSATMGIRGTAVQVDIDVNNGTTEVVGADRAGRPRRLVQRLFPEWPADRYGQQLQTVTLVTPVSPLQATAQEILKTPAELAQALTYVQQAFQTQALGQAILAAQRFRRARRGNSSSRITSNRIRVRQKAPPSRCRSSRMAPQR